MTQADADPREQLVHAERLGEVVVRTEIERLDLVALGLAGGQHDDRRVAATFRTARSRPLPVGSGQAQVEQDEVGPHRAAIGAQGLVDGARDIHGEVVETA